MNHASREEMLAAFGPFRVVFEPMGDDTTPYLSLLHLHDARSLVVVRAIRDATTEPDSTACVLTLLRDVNWRPHIVGSIAAYYASNLDAINQMWAALDAGSWAAPQIAAILSKCDPTFIDRATSRLNEHCPLSNDAEYAISSAIERHSAQGPAGSHHRSSKSATAIYALIPENLRKQLASNVELQKLIADDFDGSAEIATSWLEAFLELDAQI